MTTPFERAIDFANMQLAGALFMSLGEIPELPLGPGVRDFQLEGIKRHVGPFKNEVLVGASTIDECVEDFRQWCEAVRLESPNEPPFAFAGKPVVLVRASDDPTPMYAWKLMAIPTTPYEEPVQS